MKSIEIKAQEIVNSTVEIPIPAFYKDKYGEVLAVIDVDNVVSAYGNDTYDQVVGGTVEKNGDKILKAHKEWNQITEEEFFEHYNNIIERLSLKPILVERTTQNIYSNQIS